MALRLAVAGILCLLGACRGGDPAAVKEMRQGADGKNLVLVLLDAAAVRHFGFAGYDRDTTPNIDALAASAVLFSNAYAPAASTAHSVYGLLTSLHSFVAEEAGLRGEREDPFRVTETTPLMPELLAPRFEHRSGLSANAWFGPDFGLDRGFTRFAGTWMPSPGDSTRRAGERILDLFRQDLDSWSDGAAFSYVHFLEPHSPYTPPDSFARRYHPAAIDSIDARARSLLRWRVDPPAAEKQEMVRALYDGNLAYVDSLVGALVAELQARGKWEDTILVLAADHGEAFWQHGVQGHGRHIYDEFVRIPLMVRFPGSPQLSGTVVDEVVSLKDLLPTFLDLYRLPIPDELEGDSLLPLVAGEAREFRERLVFTRGTHNDAPEFGFRRGRHKWIYRVYEGSYRLFDLEADPDEKHPVPEDRISPELMELRKQIPLWIARGTGRISGVTDLDPETEARLRAIGYF